MTSGNYNIRISGDSKEAQNAMKGLASNMGQVTGKAKEMASAMNPLSGIMKGIGFAAVAGGVVALGGAMVKGAAELENYKAQFSVMLGTVERGDAMFKQLQTMGAKTPFETADLASATQTMLGFGIAAGDIIPNLQMLGDIAGGNAEKLKGLTLVFSQVQSAGKLTGGDLMQMINQGFNPLKEISATTGKSIAELRGEMEKGQISADMVTQAFKRATGEGGQFNGMMEKQSKTFDGMISTLKDTVGMMLADLGTQMLPMIKTLVDGLTKIFSDPKIMGAIQQIGQLLTDLLGPILGLIIPLLQQLLPPVIQVAQAIGGALVIAVKALTPILLAIVGIIQKLAPVIAKWADAWGKIFVAISPLLEVLPVLINDLMMPLLPLFTSMIDLVVALTPVLQVVAVVIAAVAKAGAWLIKTVVTPIIDAIKFIIDSAAAAVNAIASIFGGGDEEPKKKAAPAAQPKAGAPVVFEPSGAAAAPTPTKKAGGKKSKDAVLAGLALDRREVELMADSAEKIEKLYDNDVAVNARRLALKEISEREYNIAQLEAAKKRDEDMGKLADEMYDQNAKRRKEDAEAAQEIADNEYERNREALQSWIDNEREKARAAVASAERVFNLRVKLMDDEDARTKVLHQRALADLRDRYDQELMSEEEYLLEKELLEKENEKAVAKSKTEVAAGVAENLLSIGKSAFGESKSMAVAEAIINTLVGATKALNQGGILGILTMAAVIAAGMAQVAKITATEPQGKAAGGDIGKGFYAVGEQGDEFVMNAAATRRNRPALLAMNAGATIGQAFGYENAPGTAGARYQPLDVQVGGELRIRGDDLILAYQRNMRRTMQKTL